MSCVGRNESKPLASQLSVWALEIHGFFALFGLNKFQMSPQDIWVLGMSINLSDSDSAMDGTVPRDQQRKSKAFSSKL